MGRAFKTFLQGVTGFMNFLKEDKLDDFVDRIKSIGNALHTWPSGRKMTAMGNFFKYMGAINWGDIKDFGGLKIEPLDKKSTDNWIDLLDELDDFMDDGDLPVLVDMFDKLSKIDVGNFDLSKFELKPIDAKQVKHYSDLIDKLIKLADESEGSTFVLGNMSGTVVQGGAQYTKKTSTSTTTTIGGASTTPTNVVREATRTPAESVVTTQPDTGGRKRITRQTREFRIAGEPIGDKLTKKQMSMISMARQMSEENFKRYPPRIQQMYLEQSTGQTKVSPPKKKPSLGGARMATDSKLQERAKAQYQKATLARENIKQQIAGLGEQEVIGRIKGTMQSKYGFKDAEKQKELDRLQALDRQQRDRVKSAGQAFTRAEGVRQTYAFGGKGNRLRAEAQAIKRLLASGLLGSPSESVEKLKSYGRPGWEQNDMIRIGRLMLPRKPSLGLYEEWTKRRLAEGMQKPEPKKKPTPNLGGAKKLGYHVPDSVVSHLPENQRDTAKSALIKDRQLFDQQEKLKAEINEVDKAFGGWINMDSENQAAQNQRQDMIYKLDEEREGLKKLFQPKMTPSMKLDPESLAMDPSIKRLDLIPSGAAAGQTQVANNSGNYTNNTQHYHSGKGSRTDDPRLLRLAGTHSRDF